MNRWVAAGVSVKLLLLLLFLYLWLGPLRWRQLHPPGPHPPGTPERSEAVVGLLVCTLGILAITAVTARALARDRLVKRERELRQLQQQQQQQQQGTPSQPTVYLVTRDQLLPRVDPPAPHSGAPKPWEPPLWDPSLEPPPTYEEAVRTLLTAPYPTETHSGAHSGVALADSVPVHSGTAANTTALVDSVPVHSSGVPSSVQQTTTPQSAID